MEYFVVSVNGTDYSQSVSSLCTKSSFALFPERQTNEFSLGYVRTFPRARTASLV
jgi:hypothetical protein